MPFEAFLAQGKTKPRKARWLTGSLSLTFHGGLVVAALILVGALLRPPALCAQEAVALPEAVDSSMAVALPLVRDTTSSMARLSPSRFFSSAFRMTGTISPCGAATAMPMW